MPHPLVLQTLEFLKIINGMEYFTSEQRLSILHSIGENVVDKDLGIISEEVLSIHTLEDWEKIPEHIRTLVQEICTDPSTPSALTQALYTHTNTPSKAPDSLAIEQMQAEIEQQAKAEFEEWLKEETNTIDESEQNEEDQISETPEPLPIPLENDNWDIGLVLYHPVERCFYVHFLQSGASQKVPCVEDSSQTHPNPYLLSVSTQNIFSNPLPQNVFSSFSTPKFSNQDYLRKFNKKKKKVFFLQLRQFHSNPVQNIFQCTSEYFQVKIAHDNQSRGLRMRQTQSVSIRSRLGHKPKLEGLAPFIKQSSTQHVYTGKEQNSTGWSLDWIGPHSIEIYAKEGNLHRSHLSSGNHSNSITQKISICHESHKVLPISHHKMPYSGIMQTHNDSEVVSFENLVQEENLKRAPQLGKTGPIDQSETSQILKSVVCDNQVLLSEQKTVLTTTQNNIPFHVKTNQECTHDTHIIIPCTRSKTLEIHTDSLGQLNVQLGMKKYTFTPVAQQKKHIQKANQPLQTNAHKDWNSSFLQELSSEQLQITQTVINEESGFL